MDIIIRVAITASSKYFLKFISVSLGSKRLLYFSLKIIRKNKKNYISNIF